MDSYRKIVLSFGDSVLREADVELLNGPYWLNDNIISFYFEYLSMSVFSNRNDILFVSPEVTHCLKAAKTEELPIFLDPLNAKDKKLVLFAFNDHRTFEKSGGTHWSLLVYCADNNCMYHIDSMSGVNFRQAAVTTGKLLLYLSPIGTGDFQELPCLQQDNGYDCGIFVLAHAQFLAENFQKGTILAGCEKMLITDIKDKRAEILHLINNLSSN